MRSVVMSLLGALTISTIAVAQTPPRSPPEQEAFSAAIDTARTAYANGKNEMEKGAARPMRAKAICAALKRKVATDWVGEVYKLSSNSDGKGVLAVTIGKDVMVKTWNNSFSDIADETLIDPDRPVFKQAAALSAGQKVRFSGRFIASSTDCVRESSLTISGSLNDPEFIFRFEKIEPVATGQ